MVTTRTSSKKSGTGNTPPTGAQKLTAPPKQFPGSACSVAKPRHKRVVDVEDLLSRKKLMKEDMLSPEKIKKRDGLGIKCGPIIET